MYYLTFIFRIAPFFFTMNHLTHPTNPPNPIISVHSSKINSIMDTYSIVYLSITYPIFEVWTLLEVLWLELRCPHHIYSAFGDIERVVHVEGYEGGVG